MSNYLYSICMGCTHFDLYQKDNKEWECKCDKGKKLIIPTVEEQNCSDYIKASKLPWWYSEISGFPEIKPFKKVFEKINNKEVREK